MLFHLFLLVLIIFTLFFFYTDVMNKINTNKPFAEGMANATQLAEYMGAKGGYDFASADAAKAKCEEEGLQLCKKEEVIAGAKSKDSLENVCSTGWTQDAPRGWYSVKGRSGCGSNNNWNTWAPSSGKGSAHCCKPVETTASAPAATAPNASGGGDSIGLLVTYEMITDKPDFCGNDGFKSTKMEWSGEVCEGGKIKWNSMKSLAGTTRPEQAGGCSWNREGKSDEWKTKYIGSCGVSPTYVSLPTTVTELQSKKGSIGEFDHWRKKFVIGSETTVSSSKPYGSVVSNWDECKDVLNKNPEAKQVVYSKSNKACYPMKHMAPEDQDGEGGVNYDWISAQKLYINVPTAAPASAASAGMNIIPTTSMNTTSSTKETSSVDPTTGAKVTEKCVTVTELSTAAKWVDHLFGTLSNTKCADKEKVMAAKTASKTDFISGIIKGYQNDKDGSNQYYMQAIDKAKPMLDAAFDVKVHSAATPNSQHPLLQGGEGEGEGEGEHLQNNVTDTMMDGATNGLNQNGSVPDVTTLEDELKQTPAYQHAVNQISGNNNNANYQMANGNLVQPPTGDCPNGCRAPQYDNDKCTNLELGGKAYRSCPWIGDGSINDSMCKDCGSILLPKNEHGYARTRPGLYNKNTINKLLAGTTFNKEPEKSNVNYTNIGLEFMTELSRARNFNLPYISQQNYEKIGRIVSKYQLDVNTGNTNKKDLTDIINGVLNSGTIPTSLNSVSDNLTGQIQSNTDGFSLQTVTDKPATSTDTGRSEKLIKGLLGKTDYYESSSIGLQEKQNDNRLGGSKTLYSGYTTKYRPQDPRKGVKPYDSIWELFKQ